MNERQVMEELERRHPELVDRVQQRRMSLEAACTIANIDYRPVMPMPDRASSRKMSHSVYRETTVSSELIEIAKVLYCVMDEKTRQRLQQMMKRW